MFTDIATARRHAFSLSRSLMVVTFVIAIGQHYGVITAEDADGSVALVAEYDPFACWLLREPTAPGFAMESAPLIQRK